MAAETLVRAVLPFGKHLKGLAVRLTQLLKSADRFVPGLKEGKGQPPECDVGLEDELA